MIPHMLQNLEDSSYNSLILEMKICGRQLSTNLFVREVRRKYWTALFISPKFTGNMTSNLSSRYHGQVAELTNYDFSEYNIRTIQVEMGRNLIKGIEDCIIELFDRLSHQYAYSDELQNNIHYYNGWKTNKAWSSTKKSSCLKRSVYVFPNRICECLKCINNNLIILFLIRCQGDFL